LLGHLPVLDELQLLAQLTEYVIVVGVDSGSYHMRTELRRTPFWRSSRSGDSPKFV
jgi:hypothetical protein